ncbi:MAG TPA: hypothetical protein PLE10_00930 [Brevefilum sp.]|nr:hypothetical protein [Brevefilum sp.]HOR18381.1 hypothetical protein [Brevefilum sp.]
MKVLKINPSDLLHSDIELARAYQASRQSVSSLTTNFWTIDPSMSQQCWIAGIGSRFPFNLENSEPSM